jgi:hypothetical protein
MQTTRLRPLFLEHLQFAGSMAPVIARSGTTEYLNFFGLGQNEGWEVVLKKEGKRLLLPVIINQAAHAVCQCHGLHKRHQIEKMPYDGGGSAGAPENNSAREWHSTIAVCTVVAHICTC